MPDGWSCHGQENGESAALSRLALHFNGTAVLMNDPIADAQAQARALADWFCGEERVEDSLHNGRIDAGSAVYDFDSHLPVGVAE